MDAPFSEAFHSMERIPADYGRDRIVLLAKDPYWVYAYWEISQKTRERFLSFISPEQVNNWSWALKITITDRSYTQEETPRYHTLGLHTTNMFIHIDRPNSVIRAEYGLLSLDYDFFPILSSNTIVSPPNGVSEHRGVYFANIFEFQKGWHDKDYNEFWVPNLCKFFSQYS